MNSATEGYCKMVLLECSCWGRVKLQVTLQSGTYPLYSIAQAVESCVLLIDLHLKHCINLLLID